MKTYKPKEIDQRYMDYARWQFDRQSSKMPKEVDFTFNYQFSGIEIDKNVITELNDAFCKFGNMDETRMDPNYMKREFKKNGLD